MAQVEQPMISETSRIDRGSPRASVAFPVTTGLGQCCGSRCPRLGSEIRCIGAGFTACPKPDMRPWYRVSLLVIAPPPAFPKREGGGAGGGGGAGPGGPPPSSPPPPLSTYYFWSGEGGEALAQRAAFVDDGIWFGDTSEGKAAIKAASDLPRPQRRPIFARAASEYASNASGNVVAFVSITPNYASIFFDIELPELLSNPNVTGIDFVYF